MSASRKKTRGRPKGRPRTGSQRTARSARRAPRWLRLLQHRLALVVTLAGVVAAVVLAGVVALHCYGRRLGPTRAAPVAVGWPDGLDAREAAALLDDLGLVHSRAATEVFLRSSNATECFRPGPHLLPAQATPQQLRQLLCRTADRPTARVTIPEGFTRYAVADRLELSGVCSRAAFLHVSEDGAFLHSLGVEAAEVAGADSAEGYLFPATYRFPLDSDPRRVVRRLVVETDRRWRQLTTAHPGAAEQLEQTMGWGRREVLVLASMVEKEARVAEERAIIASVFLNRLRDPDFRPKLLQSDPTAIYGCLAMPARIPACADFSGRATPAINHDANNPYSTYVNTGLPPGPIANPGAPSIEAVLAPADTSYLYFVSVGDGRHHVFSDDFEAHQRAVQRLRTRSKSSE